MTGYQTERSSYDDEASSVNTPISSNGDHAMAGAYGKDGVHGYEQADHQLEPVGYAPVTPTKLATVLTRPRWIPTMRRADRLPT